MGAYAGTSPDFQAAAPKTVRTSSAPTPAGMPQGLLRLVAVVGVAAFLADESGNVPGEGRLDVQQVNFQSGVVREPAYDARYGKLGIARAVDRDKDPAHGACSPDDLGDRCLIVLVPRKTGESRADFRIQHAMVLDE